MENSQLKINFSIKDLRIHTKENYNSTAILEVCLEIIQWKTKYIFFFPYSIFIFRGMVEYFSPASEWKKAGKNSFW